MLFLIVRNVCHVEGLINNGLCFLCKIASQSHRFQSPLSVSGIKISSANERLMHTCVQVSIVFSAGRLLCFRGLLDGLTTDASILKSYVEYVLPSCSFVLWVGGADQFHTVLSFGILAIGLDGDYNKKYFRIVESKQE
jgi:hypothetical protein